MKLHNYSFSLSYPSFSPPLSLDSKLTGQAVIPGLVIYHKQSQILLICCKVHFPLVSQYYTSLAEFIVCAICHF